MKIRNKENYLDCFDLRRNRNFADSIFYDVSSDLQTKKKRKERKRVVCYDEEIKKKMLLLLD